MSTGKRLAKRSILGTRVACCLEDGKYYPGIICDVKSLEEGGPSIYSVRVEGDRRPRDLREGDLVGSGFTPVSSVKLRAEQKVFITFNNREVTGNVIYHRPNIDEVLISVTNPETNLRQEVKKRLEEVRLLESRKSARLADQDTDFAKLADCTSERNSRKTSSTIDVPGCLTNGSRKRRGSRSSEDDLTDECAAALVLMKLSCSPRSPVFHDGLLSSECFSGASSTSSSGVGSWVGGPPPPQPPTTGARSSATPSPPLSSSSSSSSPPPPPASAPLDDGIDMDDDDDPFYDDDIVPRKRRSSTRVMFKCTWKDCPEMAASCPAIERHIRTQHLGLGASTAGSGSDDEDDEDDHEEEFYWREVEVNVTTWVEPAPPSPPSPPVNASSRPPLPPSAAGAAAAAATAALTRPFPAKRPSAATLVSSSQQQQFLTPIKGSNSSVLAGTHNVSPFALVSSPPTLSHMDMARPPHEDPDYRRHYTASVLSSSWPRNPSYLQTNPQSHKAGKVRAVGGGKGGSGRGKRSGESRKCRKVYGMEQKDQWCTQCKWKKACSRFGE